MINLKEIFGFAGKKWCKRMHQQIVEEVNTQIYIKDVAVGDDVIIALHIDDIPVEGIGYSSTVMDADGYPLFKDPRKLIERMMDLREQEIDKRMREHGVIAEMNLYNLTIEDIK